LCEFGEKKMKILILGGSGLLGHRLWINLRKEHEVWVTVRQTSSPFALRPEFPINYVRTDVDASNFDQVTRALAGMVKEISSIDVPIEYAPMRPADVKHCRAEITKAQGDLNFKPDADIKKGLTKYLNWFMEDTKISG